MPRAPLASDLLGAHRRSPLAVAFDAVPVQRARPHRDERGWPALAPPAQRALDGHRVPAPAFDCVLSRLRPCDLGRPLRAGLCVGEIFECAFGVREHRMDEPRRGPFERAPARVGDVTELLESPQSEALPLRCRPAPLGRGVDDEWDGPPACLDARLVAVARERCAHARPQRPCACAERILDASFPPQRVLRALGAGCACVQPLERLVGPALGEHCARVVTEPRRCLRRFQRPLHARLGVFADPPFPSCPHPGARAHLRGAPRISVPHSRAGALERCARAFGVCFAQSRLSSHRCLSARIARASACAAAGPLPASLRAWRLSASCHCGSCAPSHAPS